MASSNHRFRRACRRLWSCLAAAAVVAGALGAAGSPAQSAAAQDRAGQLQVLGPQPGTVIVAPSAAAVGTVRAQASVQATGDVQGLALRLNGHPLAGLGAAAGVQQVPLQVADGLAVGENLLWASAEVSGQARVVPVRFYVGYQAQGLLSMQLHLGGSTGPAATATIGRPAAGIDRLEVSSNGSPVTLPAATGSGPLTLDLAQLGAVHAGQNQLAVRLLMNDGAVQTITRDFTLPAGRDIVIARADGPATVGRTAVLDANSSLLPAGSGGLSAARWTLVSRPALSRVRLGTATGPQTTLRPDVPGRYLVALRTGTGSRAGADLLTVPVAYPGLLVPLDTIAYSGTTPGVQVGPTFYASQNQALQVLVLDRGTLGFVANRGYPASTSDFAALGSYLQSLPSSDLVIVTHPGDQPALPSGTLAQLDTSLHAIGGEVAGQWVFGAGSVNASGCWSGATNYCMQAGADWQRANGGMYGGSFTIIGVPGMPAGQAWRETAAQNRTTDGRITGYLTLGTVTTGGADQYTVVNGPDPYVPVDTCTAGGCAVQVGSQAYPTAAGVSGFHVVILDRTTLQLIANSTVTTAAGLLGAISNITSVPPVAHFIQPGTPFNDQRLVIIQSVGDGTLSGTPSSQLLQYIDQLGGTPEYLLASITGAHAYALVGAAADLPWRAATSAESSTAMTDRTPGTPGQPTGRVYGVLQRDRDGLYTPSASDPVGPTNVDLYPIIYQPATAWPMADDTAGLTYVAANIGLSAYPDVRSAYPNTNIDFATKAVLLQALDCTAGPDVCGPDFPDLKAQLLKEFDWVQSVRALAGDLRAPYVQTASGPYFDVQEVTDEVLASIPSTPPDGTTTMSWLTIMKGVMSIGQNAATLAGQPEAAAVFGIAGGAGTIATQLIQQPGGSPANSITSTSSQLGQQMYQQQTAYLEWVNQAEDILVSDYGKLSAVGTAVGSDPTWDWTSSTTNTVITALDAGTRAAAYTALIPIYWEGINLKPGAGEPATAANDVTTLICDEPADGTPPTHFYPFAAALPQNQFHAVTTISSSGAETDQVWTFANFTASWVNFNSPDGFTTLPSTSLTDNIYGPQSTGPDGAYQYEASWWRDTYNPPSHASCETATGSTPIDDTISQHYPPPDITPPLP